MKHDSKETISGKKNGIKTVVLILTVLMMAGAVFTGVAAADVPSGDGSTSEESDSNNDILSDWSDTTPNALFYYEKVGDSTQKSLTGSYSNMDETLTLDGMKVLDTVASHPEGIYLNSALKHEGQPAQIMLKKLDAEITMYVHDTNGNIINSCIGGTVPQGAKVSFKVNPNHPTLYSYSTGVAEVSEEVPANLVGLKFIGPDGSGESTYLGTQNNYAATETERWAAKDLDRNLMEGTWTVWAYFVPRDSIGYFAPYTPDEYLNGTKYQFTITSSTVSMTADTDTAKVDGYVTLTISGKPYEKYYLKPNKEMYEVNPGQQNYEYQKDETEKPGENVVTIGKNGTTTLTLKALKSGTFTLQLCDITAAHKVEEDLELTFTKAKITAEVEKDQYYMGTDVKLTGTNESLIYPLYYYIEGINLPFQKIEEKDEDGNENLKHTKTSKEWETTIKGDYIKELKLDTAAYTIFISNIEEKDGVKDHIIASDAVYTAVAVNLVKPEIRITSAPSVVVQGDKLSVKGVADAAATVQYYIFGTNKFDTGRVDIGKNGAFTFERPIPKEEFDAGQYYAVIQHPMYDGKYNIAAGYSTDGKLVIALNNTGDAAEKQTDGEWHITSGSQILFSPDKRQSANAAQALCDAIDSEDIDDIWVKFSFTVTAEGSKIDPIPSQVIKGLSFTVSGSTNKVDGDAVIVELLSTTFTAASKYSATSASFITLTATPDENGKWAVTFNTDKLNVDKYTVTVKTGTVTSNPAYVEIIEGQLPATPVPTETTPESPTAAPVSPTKEAKSPGFGIAAVLAGLGAAVLLRKRA